MAIATVELPGTRRVALVTGAARRVGRAIALRLAEAGLDIAFTYHRSLTEAQQLHDELAGQGRRVLKIEADLTQPGAAAPAIHKHVAETFGQLDVLVNNASLYEASGLQKTDVRQLGRLWAIHVEAPLLLAQAFEPMLRKSRGHVVNMVDLLAERPWPEYLGYCASKAGLWNLTMGLARALAPEVTVNGIAPGVVAWPEEYPAEEQDKYLKRVPLGRAGRPEDVAELVHYLVTAGGYVTGQVIRLDGGRSLT